jgi:hypothetical protein
LSYREVVREDQEVQGYRDEILSLGSLLSEVMDIWVVF